MTCLSSGSLKTQLLRQPIQIGEVHIGMAKMTLRLPPGSLGEVRIDLEPDGLQDNSTGCFDSRLDAGEPGRWFAQDRASDDTGD